MHHELDIFESVYTYALSHTHINTYARALVYSYKRIGLHVCMEFLFFIEKV